LLISDETAIDKDGADAHGIIVLARNAGPLNFETVIR
jgi:hypothetical protein